jgi:hypothetical protein
MKTLWGRRLRLRRVSRPALARGEGTALARGEPREPAESRLRAELPALHRLKPMPPSRAKGQSPERRASLACVGRVPTRHAESVRHAGHLTQMANIARRAKPALGWKAPPPNLTGPPHIADLDIVNY